ncbi:unnamed protein product, partial [Allacma fusca]
DYHYTIVLNICRAERVKRILEKELEASHVEIINESHMHNVPKDSETHFKVVVVSPTFSGTSLISRHRTVQDLLKEELANGLHALSIVAKSPSEWSKSKPIEPSPRCLGGFGK